VNDFARHDLLYFKATKNRRLAALDWEEETGNVGAVAMIDTDYASVSRSTFFLSNLILSDKIPAG